jgi:hypothetical protein
MVGLIFKEGRQNSQVSIPKSTCNVGKLFMRGKSTCGQEYS